MSNHDRLMLAAPELLAALKQIVADWDSIPECSPVPAEINDDNHWDAARAAIDKADPNACLIAAAHELLAACKMVLDDPGLTASSNDVIRAAIDIAEKGNAT